MDYNPSSFAARLDSFFSPARIAVVGASERGMYPAGILQNLIAHPFPGDIYPINPKRERVFDLQCYARLADTPQRADLAIIVVPRGSVLPTLRECVALKIPAAVIISAGFAESDEQGRALQNEIAALVRDSTLRVVGPNCAGLADIPNCVIATRLSAPPHAGNISFVSQSGALMMALYGSFADRALGMNRLLSLGNQVDVSLAESLRYLVADANTFVIASFIESIRDGQEFIAALQDALIAGKPLVLLKSGRTELGQRAAQTHTAALAGSDRVFDAVCRQFGALRVDDVRELLDTVQIFSAFGTRLACKGRIAIVTQSGGLGSLSADMVELNGLHLPAPSKALRAQLRAIPHLAHLPAFGNPTDVQGASVIGEKTAETLKPFLDDPETDAVILLFAKAAVRQDHAETAEAITAAARNSNKPLAVVWVGQKFRHDVSAIPLAPRMLLEAGIPLFEQPSDCVRALARAIHYWNYREEWLNDPELARRRKKDEG